MKEMRVKGQQIINTNRRKSMRERSVVSYGYLTRDISKCMMEAEPAIMNYSTFEEQFLRDTKANVRRSARRRAEKSRSQQYSDVESDAGSDGVTVNSAGSGRSGDWAPPRRRVKGKRDQKNRSDSRPSLTDSGISLAKTDFGSLSSCQRFEDDVIPGDDQLIQHSYDTTSSAPSNNKPAINTHRRCSLRRSSSLSALPSFVKALDRHNPRLSRRDSSHDGKYKDLKITIQEQENAILAQCYQNEGLVTSPEYHNNSNGKSYIFDCSQPLTKSKFPLPDHLNYPLCKYRYKSESVLNRVSPLKKLREGWKKIKPRRAFSEEKETAESTISTLSSGNFFEEISDDEDNEAILARLSSNPSQSKSFLKKLWNKVGSKSYSASDKIKHDLSSSWNEPSFHRSVSTRSIPEALKDMWNKVHDVEIIQPVGKISTMSRAASMPSLLSGKEKIEVSGHQREQANYFSNFFKPMEIPANSEQPKAKMANGTDVVKGVLGQDTPKFNKYAEAKQILIDATLTSVTDNLQKNKKPQNSKRTVKVDQNENIEIVNNDNLGEFNRQFPLVAEPVIHEQQNLKERKISQHSMYASSFDIESHCASKSHFYDPLTYYGGQNNMGHCTCCMHHNMPPQYAVPYYPQPSFVYEVPHPYGMYSSRPNGPYVSNGNPNSVVAPLDVQMSIERKAERRKISDMVFDTFV